MTEKVSGGGEKPSNLYFGTASGQLGVINGVRHFEPFGDFAYFHVELANGQKLVLRGALILWVALGEEAARPYILGIEWYRGQHFIDLPQEFSWGQPARIVMEKGRGERG